MLRKNETTRDKRRGEARHFGVQTGVVALGEEKEGEKGGR